MLFDDLPNKCTNFEDQGCACFSSDSRKRHITNMSTIITEQQTVALKAANVFVVVDKSININGNPRLAVVARYCSNGEIHEELCCLKPMHGTTRRIDILDTFNKNFE